MSVLGNTPSLNDDVVLVFRPPENPAAQIVGITPFKSLRLRLDELLDWFKDLNVDTIDLWIEGAWKSGNHTELFLSVEGRTGAKLTLRPFAKQAQVMVPVPAVVTPAADTEEHDSKEAESKAAEVKKPEKTAPVVSTVTAFFCPAGGIERHIVALIQSAVTSIEMAAYRLTNMYVEKALLESIKRGVKVDILLDRIETRGRQADVHDNLEKAGCETRLVSPFGGSMHDKYLIIDGKTVQWGSYNYTEHSENENFENATFSTDNSLAQQYHVDFESMFGQAKPEARRVRSVRRFFRSFRRITGE